MRLDNYENYKDSEVEWLGDIPKYWRIKRVKDLTITKSGTTPLSGNRLYYENGVYNWVRTTDLNDSELYDVEYKITELALSECRLTFLPVNSILIAMYGGFGTIGKNSILKKESTINQSVCAILPNKKKYDSNYLIYFLKYFRSNWKLFADGTRKDPNINQDAVKNLLVFAPPLKEQTQIANYLENKTNTIDKKTKLLEQKILKYKELRKSIINKAVTKGLDENVKLKNSGIDWVGKTPKHWEVSRMKDIGFLYSGLSGKSGDDFNQEENKNNRGFLPFTNIAANTYIKTNNFGTVVIKEGEKQNKIGKNDLFFLMSSEGYEDIGKSALLDGDMPETYLNSFCKGFRIFDKQIEPKYLNWLLLSSIYRESLIVQGKGFTRINLKMEKINDFKIVIPPSKEEQKKIAKFIDDKITTIDNIIGNIEKQIETLAELRKTLINDVVTGKLQVCETVEA